MTRSIASLVLLLVAVPLHARNVTILVFGDSWGSLGPSWHELVDIFAKHKIPATVKSSAVGGTRACQWASEPQAINLEAAKLFPDQPVDYLWYTAGGNDLANKWYVACSEGAKTYDKAIQCMKNAMVNVNNCTETMLTKFLAPGAHPDSKVLQVGYDLPCEVGRCVTDPRFAFCGTNRSCQNSGTVAWQPLLLGPMAAKFPAHYTGIDILGTVQAAGGVAGAATGKPVIDTGSPCGLMTACVHPRYGGAGATAVGDAMWDLYFSKQNFSRILRQPQPPQPQGDTARPSLRASETLVESDDERRCHEAGDGDDDVHPLLREVECMWDWRPRYECAQDVWGCINIFSQGQIQMD